MPRNCKARTLDAIHGDFKVADDKVTDAGRAALKEGAK